MYYLVYILYCRRQTEHKYHVLSFNIADPDIPASSKKSTRDKPIKESRGVKYMGEKHRHQTQRHVTIDDRESIVKCKCQNEAEDEFPLLVEVTRPLTDECFTKGRIIQDDKTPEIVHYIDRSAAEPVYELYEPIFVQPHKPWKVIC